MSQPVISLLWSPKGGGFSTREAVPQQQGKLASESEGRQAVLGAGLPFRGMAMPYQLTMHYFLFPSFFPPSLLPPSPNSLKAIWNSLTFCEREKKERKKLKSFTQAISTDIYTLCGYDIVFSKILHLKLFCIENIYFFFTYKHRYY